MRYSDFVNYSRLNPFKKRILKYIQPTFDNLSCLKIKIVKESLGEPAVLLDFLEYDFLLAFKSDGVGTKTKIAEEMVKEKPKISSRKLYSGFGIDLIAMNANDLICVGATPVALSDEIASGDSLWLRESEKVEGLLLGFKRGCREAGITIPCGETPTLVDIIYPQTLNITCLLYTSDAADE